jgi:hypothetical protein
MILVLAMLGGCATTGGALPPPPDPHYEQGISAFEGGRWLEAIANLRKVVVPTCRPVSTTECARIVLMLMRSDLELGNPAQAVIDAYFFENAKGSEPKHDPAIADLSKQAAEALRTAWKSGDRSTQLQIAVTDGVQEPLEVVKIAYELDMGEQVDIPRERLTETYLVDIPAPAGSHLLHVRAEYAANGAKFKVAARRSFTAKPGDQVTVLVKVHDATVKQDLKIEFSGVTATTDIR